jgi:hypothetical protein
MYVAETRFKSSLQQIGYDLVDVELFYTAQNLLDRSRGVADLDFFFEKKFY